MSDEGAPTRVDAAVNAGNATPAARRPLVVYGITKGGQPKDDRPGFSAAALITTQYFATRGYKVRGIDADPQGQLDWKTQQ